ncbi:initiator tRNA phosphoribosyl transferase [Trichocladium antarcticum]|uniref:Initiator tRNA phosphoribosyl transferase n=1 Tax=Trichocladium antarcticum TaxID=1450529 RepID=A0AAN6US33_9PEZI|nr:initiator tRNA phosphoribosyl transferase [Trichocladium antarcticum]
MPAPTLAEVIFPEQANHNFSRILGDLKRSNLSITNRLGSIRHDASFVEDVAAALKLPLVANERCGSWYIDPARKAGSAYFKSTDGHTGQWKFSTRRLNLHLLELIGEHDGLVVFKMPDALSKTIPIWCAVLNRILFPAAPHHHQLFVPPSAVSASEASQIAARLPEFEAAFRALALDAAPLRARLTKPLRPVWTTPDDDGDAPAAGPVAAVAAAGFHPVVCCTSSRRVAGAEVAARGYIQGAGDDTENWAMGLTAGVFWRHAAELLGAAEGELPGLIAGFLEEEAQDAEAALGAGDCCVVSLLPRVTEQSVWAKSARHLEVGLGKSKAASRALRNSLPRICEFVSRFLNEPGTGDGKRVVVLCESGRELSVGVALAVYCWCFGASGDVRPDGDRESFNKTAIRVKLGQIMTALPDANPSRATLQSVNSYLMDWRK